MSAEEIRAKHAAMSLIVRPPIDIGVGALVTFDYLFL
jgi:hypothetical protein